MSAQKKMLLVPDGPRIQWVMQHGYLHIIWPEQIEDWEIEFVEELLPMALKQMRKAAAKRAAEALTDAERTKVSSQASGQDRVEPKQKINPSNGDEQP